MPSASDELHVKMRLMFGAFVSDAEPWDFLQKAGYTEHQYFIRKPNADHKVTRSEWNCICFLCDEWDWAYAGE